jgi:hypothetical protein
MDVWFAGNIGWTRFMGLGKGAFELSFTRQNDDEFQISPPSLYLPTLDHV